MLAHHISDGWLRPGSTVHFVTDRIESAVNQAKTATAGKTVGVHGADTIQQYLNAGLLDEIHIDMAAVMLGSGIRFFNHLADTPIVLGNPTVIQGIGVTHRRFPVRTKESDSPPARPRITLSKYCPAVEPMDGCAAPVCSHFAPIYEFEDGRK